MKIGTLEIAKSLGLLESDLNDSTKKIILDENLELISLTTEERDNLVLEIIDRIRNDNQIIAAIERTQIWENGWKENLDSFRANPNSDEALIPKFVRPRKPIRWFGDYYFTNNENFELSYIKILRQYVVSSYFSNISHLYEFGAGTGFNLLHANKIFPQLNLIGTDFVKSAVDLINEVGVARNIPLTASVFNMLHPNEQKFSLKENSGVWTFGSLEQLGSNVKPMIDFLIANQPDICVHIEPVAEFYDRAKLTDYLAYWFQNKRGYSEGLVSLLLELEVSKKIEIIKMQRLNFGSLMMEGYNLIIWRPVK